MSREIIQSSLDYIEDNLKAEITAEELSHQAGFSLTIHPELIIHIEKQLKFIVKR